MSQEERDRKFEQALARQLRRDAGGARNDVDAHGAVPEEAGGSVACLDAATLAAFHEGMLSSLEMNAAKEHIGDCSRCQEVLMQLGATEEIPLQVEAENDLKMREAVPTEARRADGAAIQTPGLTMTAPASALKATKDISRGRRGFKVLRWAAPAGAIAAGLLVWFVARDNKVQTLSPVDKVQVAQEQPREERLGAPQPLPTSPSNEPPAKTKELNGRRKDESRIKRPREESDALRAPASSSSTAVVNGMGDVAGEVSSGANTRQLQSQGRDYASRAAAENKPDISSRQADVSVMTAAPPLPPELAKKSANESEVAQKDARRNGAGSAVKAQVTANFESSALAEKAAQARIIVAPTGTVRWRLGIAGRVERSVDSGVTWVAQNSGVKAELLAGSAPSEVVCWIVGRGATILRTTDGGGHWSKIVSPISGDVAGVQAVDVMTAEIFDANKSVRFVTRDGGVSWEAAKD
jgi:Photosynthesis system II assembly factor YCF48